MADEFRRPFDLGEPLLPRVRLLRRAEEDHILTIVAHHLVADGHALDLMWAELAELYRAARSHTAPRLAEPGLQYADYAEWEAEWLRSRDYAEHIRFFREQLRDAPRPSTSR
ncbi:condensation domain-containing protein [Streptomyces sp. M19]